MNKSFDNMLTSASDGDTDKSSDITVMREMKMPNLTQERLRQVLDYDPATGVFVWKVRPSNRIHIGDRAGVVAGLGRRFIMVDGEKFQAHRLAWFYVHGAWPEGDLKQKNGDHDDCSLDNLMPISRIEQARLRSTLTTNTSGFRGVSQFRKDRWQATVTANYQQVKLGAFKTKEEASAAYEHAMSILAGAKTAEECDLAVDKIIQHRRKRVAWSRLERTGRPHVWTDFETFCSDIGRMDDDESTVAAVDESKPISASNFRWLLRPQGEFARGTKPGNAAYMKAYREANPGRWRHSHLKKNYEIDDVTYGRMLNDQFGVCAICGKDETENRGQDGRRLCVDHDKDRTGPEKNRGLLCGNCNHAIGYFQHDPRLLRAAADYMDRYLARVGDAGKSVWTTPTVTEITHLPVGQRLLQEAAGHG